MEILLRTSQHEFPIVDASGRVYGIVTRDDIIRALRHVGPHLPVIEAMRRDIPAVRHTAALDEAFRLMQRCACPALPVVDRAGRLVGMITPENVGELMMIRSITPKRGKLAWHRAS